VSAATLAGISTYDATHVSTLLASSANALMSVSAAAATAVGKGAQAAMAVGSPVLNQVHVTADGGVLTTSSFASGGEGDVVLRGTIGPFSYELHLKVAMNDGVITVTVEMTKPFKAGPFEWKFNLGGIVRDAKGQIIGASGVTAAPDMVAVAGLDWWCALRCGGLAILGILVRCLPALTGGIPGYVACVTSQAGSGAAGIAVCIATKCH
jgi:hypothetical protein